MSPLQIIGMFAGAITFGCWISWLFVRRAARRYPTPEPVEHFKGDVP